MRSGPDHDERGYEERGYDERDRGRWVPEEPSPGRTPFERDRARVLHSAALRRLAAKTQVVDPSDELGDVPRTRLTHSLECAQIGRELGEALGCDPDLVDAACLAHDLGHPPFGHNGETALDEVATPCGGFEGNAQSLRLLTRLEAKVEGAGLNLTRAVLDAATKYPWPRRAGTTKYGVYADDEPVFAWFREGVAEDARPLEAQVMDWADDVAYSVHDFEDGVRAGHVRLDHLRDADEAAELVAVAARVYSDEQPDVLTEALHRLLALPCWPVGYDGGARSQVALKQTTSLLIGRFCRAAEAATRDAYGGGRLTRYAAPLLVPAPVRAECAVLKAVTARYVMARPGAAERQAQQRELVAELAAALLAGAPGTLEPLLRPAWAAAPDDAGRLRVVVDQVALLTDLSATVRHAALVGGAP